jgi:hypothetical protein
MLDLPRSNPLRRVLVHRGAAPAVAWAAVALAAALAAAPAAGRQPVTASTARAAADPSSDARTPAPMPRIVNGVLTQDFPTAAALIDASGIQFCSGVLVGCRTVLTAAHCVCSTVGSQCQPGGPALRNPDSFEVFLPHAGSSSVQSIAVPPLFDFGVRDDIAVLRLDQSVDGVKITPVNSVERLADGTFAEIVGYGLASDEVFDNGLKRVGGIVTAPCTVVPGDEYVCWNFDQPLGPPGTDSNTCAGDSGGPLYYDFGSGHLVAGIGSGGVNADCQPNDDVFDADVFANLTEIAAAAGADLDAAECGPLPDAPGPGAVEIHSSGMATQGQLIDSGFQVAAGAKALRVGLNAEEGLFFNDFDLVIHRGGPPPAGVVECSSTRNATYEFCEILDPAPGPWNARVAAALGDGRYQLTVTVLGEVDLGPCVPGPHTLCIDDAPGDARFQADIAFDTVQAQGLAGMGNAIELDSVGVAFGGVFWFRNQQNPEVLLKVLNGCGVNGHHWVFWSAGTDVRMTVTVTDRRTARQRVYKNPDRHPALPITDTAAFTC